MGSELQGKYQKLAQEYAKLRMQIDVLKKAVRDEQAEKAKLEEDFREKSLTLRKHVQENESLEFRNQQLSKRVAVLQEELDVIKRGNKRKKQAATAVDDLQSVSSDAYDIQSEELAAKITENETLHSKVMDLTQKYEKTVDELTGRVRTLEQEVSSHNSVIDELNKEHKCTLESLRTEKALLEAKVNKLIKSLEESQQLAAKLQASREQEVQGQLSLQKAVLFPSSGEFSVLNLPTIDTKIQNQVYMALTSGVELVTTIATQISTLHSYLEQRCKLYPLDTSSGLCMSIENQKLCELLHSSSNFTKPLIITLSAYCEQLEKNPYILTTSTDLAGFAMAYRNFTVFMEAVTPYMQLSLQMECKESVCGPQLTNLNMLLCNSHLQLAKMLSSVSSYLCLITKGVTGNIPTNNILMCVERLNGGFRDVLASMKELCTNYASKVTHEYQLPTSNQELNTTNECIVSSLTGICATAEQILDYLERHAELFRAALVQSLGTEHQVASVPSVVKQLRVRATHFIQRLQRNCPDSVPYTLAVYNSRSLSSSSESKETLTKQVIAGQEKISKLEQEKEQLILDFHLLKVKHEKETKKAALLESMLAQNHNSDTVQGNGDTWNPQTIRPPTLSSKSVGSLKISTLPQEEADENLREELIRRHFAARITELNTCLQEAEGKTVHYYAECRALQKQFLHLSNVKNKMQESFQAVNATNSQLKDELSITKENYDKQLSTMSDHVCELNDKLTKQSEELETLKKSKGKRQSKQ
eukprot:Em0016g546a